MEPLQVLEVVEAVRPHQVARVGQRPGPVFVSEVHPFASARPASTAIVSERVGSPPGRAWLADQYAASRHARALPARQVSASVFRARSTSDEEGGTSMLAPFKYTIPVRHSRSPQCPSTRISHEWSSTQDSQTSARVPRAPFAAQEDCGLDATPRIRVVGAVRKGPRTSPGSAAPAGGGGAAGGGQMIYLTSARNSGSASSNSASVASARVKNLKDERTRRTRSSRTSSSSSASPK